MYSNMGISRQLEKKELAKQYVSQDANKVSIFDKSQKGNIFTKVQDSVIFQNAGHYTFSSLAPNACEDLIEAWEEAAEKVGINALDGSTATQLSALFALQTEQRVTNHTTDVFGSSIGSSISAITKALQRIEDSVGQGNSKVQEYKTSEKKFYEQLLSNLYARL